MFPTTLNLELSCPKGKTHFPKDYVYKDETIECLDSDFCLCLAWLDLLSLLFAPSLCLFLYDIQGVPKKFCLSSFLSFLFAPSLCLFLYDSDTLLTFF